MLRSLTNLDIDSRGRVWVCDVMNYRRNNGSRPEGDRILILEDTTGDGVMDKVTTFYQGRDIDSAMGICVLENESGCDVIVTASPNVWRFTDADGDGVPESKTAMFTGVGNPQHDHSGHSFLFGPDGKLYWNFGNTGQQVKNGYGETVIDIHGRAVVDNGAPLIGGMPFRCDLDGSNFEVLAHNFRNNWETTVDSFGTLWQSDNDDDGNRGTRINFVMEQGNYGYRDEKTLAGWRDERINMEAEIMHRHWHLNDPGVVPNMLQTGAGSPSGICFYEGRLLPERFWDQIIHCDPGPNIVRAYPATPDGAGYKATIEPLMTGTTDQWFRPADVCTAPDGSLFVTDWYDPGVGGHHQGDSDRGRLFRLAPPGTKYSVPTFDFTTASGAVAALRNPNLAVRSRAWRSLHAMGAAAEPELRKLYDDANPRFQARALWLLGKIQGQGKRYVTEALADSNPDIRITAIRLAKQLTDRPSSWLSDAADDKSVAVRRELAIALRFDKSDSMPALWAKLATAYDGKDRWYLEALGIGSDVRSDDCFDAYLSAVKGRWDNDAGRDIVWRVRAVKAADAMVSLIADPKRPLGETDRYFRSLEFHDSDVRTAALERLLPSRQDAIIVRAVERMKGFDYRSNPSVKAAVLRQIARSEGTPEFMKLVKRFQPDGIESQLTKTLIGDDRSAAVEAAEMLLELDAGRKEVRILIDSKQQSLKVIETLGLLGNGRANHLLAEIAVDADRPYDRRRAAVAGLARSNAGQTRLIQLATEKTLVGDTFLVAGAMLARSKNQKIRADAAKILPQPAQKDATPLPPVDELAKISGDVAAGIKLFRGAGTCANCHIVGEYGKDVGPNLSEIGSKLSREAMLTAILAPSAGISHNYENFNVLTEEGQIITGLKISETDDEVVIRTADAINRKIPTQEVAQIKQSEKSIMPEDLHHITGQQGLIDVIEYLMSLKKKG